MNSNSKVKIELALARLEPSESMPEFDKVWRRFEEVGGMPKVGQFSLSRFFRSLPSSLTAMAGATALAVTVALIIIFQLLASRPFFTPGEWVNNTTEYIKVNWRGHSAAVSPGCHFKLEFPGIGTHSVLITLYNGKILCHPQRLVKNEKFIVSLPDAEVSVRGTMFSVLIDGTLRRVTVAEGQVWIHKSGTKEEMTVTQGKTMEWRIAVKESVRSSDGEDLSDMVRELGLNKRLIKNWSINLPESSQLYTAVSADNVLWTAAGSGLWELSGDSGARLVFRHPQEKTLSQPVISGNQALIGAPEGGIWVIQKDGKVLKNIPTFPGYRPFASPAFSDQWIALPALDANIWLYQLTTGHKENIPTPDAESAFGSPYINSEKNLLYFSTGSGWLYTYDLKEKKIKSKTAVFSEKIIFPLINSGNYLAVFDRKTGRIAYFNMDTGKVDSVLEQPELSGIDHFPVKGGNGIYWFNQADPSGTIYVTTVKNSFPAIWKLAETGSTINGIAWGNGHIFVSTVEGNLIQYQDNGKKDWREPYSGTVIGATGSGFYLADNKFIYYYTVTNTK